MDLLRHQSEPSFPCRDKKQQIRKGKSMTRSDFRWTTVVVVLIALSLAASTVYGQELETGEAESTFQAGLVSGIGTHGSFGASVGTLAAPKVFVLGEFFYIPLGGGNVEAFGFRSGGSAKAYGFNFGGQYMFHKSGTLAPYAGAGLAILRNSINYSSTVGGTTTTVKASGTDAYLTLSGGGRYYASDRWGFKPELTLFVGSNTFVRIGGGIFYQFGK
jgi:hypothetical protein